MNNLSRLINKTDIIYDFDGTIARIDMDWTGWHEGLERLFEKYDKGYVKGADVEYLQNTMIKKFGRSLRDDILKFTQQYEIDNCKGVIPNKDLIEFITKNESKRHYLLTSQCHLLLDSLLKELDIDDCFTKIVTRNDVFYIKPDTEGINTIVQDRDISNFIMLGDALVDEETANAVGMDFEYIEMSS